MINRTFLMPDGRVLLFHEFYQAEIDMDKGIIKYLTKSKETETFAEFVVLYVEIQFQQWSPDLIKYESAIEVLSTGQLKLYGVVEPTQKTFSEIKAEKSEEISSACRAQIYGGYDSDALGSLHHYPAKDRDQSNMIASVTDSYNPDNPSDWTTLFWCMDGAGLWDLRPHTASQIRKAGADGKAAIQDAIVKNAQLQVQIVAASTQSELDLIVWG